MPPVKPTSTENLRPKTQQRAVSRAGENVVPRPTPTQEENDLAAAGVYVEQHAWDGTPLQNAPPVELPPPDSLPAPTISSLSPNSAVSGDPTDITMVVNGTGFTPQSVIVFNNYDEPTTFGSTSQVSTGVKPSLFVVPAVCQVSVRNGSNNSNELPFTFTETGAGTQRTKR